MPEKINGLPLHPLVVHVAVVLTPLAALAAIVFALVPRWRYLLRWPTGVGAVVAFVILFVARQSGHNLKNTRLADATGLLKERIDVHVSRATTLFNISIGFVIVAVAATLLLGSRRPRLPVVAQWALAIVLAGVSIATLVYVFLAGEAGSRAVWGQ